MTQMKNKQTDTHSTRMKKNEFNLYIFLLVLSQRWREYVEGVVSSWMRQKVEVEKAKKVRNECDKLWNHRPSAFLLSISWPGYSFMDR